MVLHRDRREHLARGAELVHVAGGERREQHGRGFATRVDRVPRGRAREQPFLGRLVPHLLDPDDEHEIVHAGGDGHRPDSECVRTRRARVLDACARDAREPDRGGHRVAADALLAPQRAALGGDEGRVDRVAVEALVDRCDGGIERAGGHVLVGLLEELAHLDESGADDGDLVPGHQTGPPVSVSVSDSGSTGRTFDL